MTYWIHYRLVHREDASFAGGKSFFFLLFVLFFVFFCPLSISCISASFFHLLLHNICHARGAVYIHLIVSTSASVFSLGGLTLFSLSISSSILFCTLAFNFTPTQSLFLFHLRCIPPAPPLTVLLLSPPLSIPSSEDTRLTGCVWPGQPDVRRCWADHLLKAALTVH